MLICSSAHLLICSSAHRLICSSAHLLICSSAHLLLCSSAPLFICSSAHSLICLSAHLQIIYVDNLLTIFQHKLLPTFIFIVQQFTQRFAHLIILLISEAFHCFSCPYVCWYAANVYPNLWDTGDPQIVAVLVMKTCTKRTGMKKGLI